MLGFTNFKHFCTIGDSVEVTVSSLNEEGVCLVHIEEPDEQLIFKELDVIPSEFKVLNNSGFSEFEEKYYLNFIKNNLHLLLTTYEQEEG